MGFVFVGRPLGRSGRRGASCVEAGIAVDEIHAHDRAVLSARETLCVKAVALDHREVGDECVELLQGFRRKRTAGQLQRVGDMAGTPRADDSGRNSGLREHVERGDVRDGKLQFGAQSA